MLCDLCEKIAVFTHRERFVEVAAERNDAAMNQRGLPIKQWSAVQQRAIEWRTEHAGHVAMLVDDPG